MASAINFDYLSESNFNQNLLNLLPHKFSRNGSCFVTDWFTLVTFPEASETLNLSFPTLHFSSALYLN